MQHTAATTSVVMYRSTRPLALRGLVFAILALVPNIVASQDVHAETKLNEAKEHVKTMQSMLQEAKGKLLQEAKIEASIGFIQENPESSSETTMSGHILFKAARKKHNKHKSTSESATHAEHAIEAAESAGQAATIAHRVANHAEVIESHASDALAYAKDALRGAAVHAGGGSNAGALQDALTRVDQVSNDAATATRYSSAAGGGASGGTGSSATFDKLERRLGRLQDKLDTGKDGVGAGAGAGAGASTTDAGQVEAEMSKMQQKLDAMKKAQQQQPGGVNPATEALQEKLRELERQMKASEVARAAGLEPPPGTASDDELKVKLEETREELGRASADMRAVGTAGAGGQQAGVDSEQRLKELQDQLDKLRQLRAKEAQLKNTPDDEALKAEVDALRKELGAGTAPGEAERKLAAEIAKLEQEMNGDPGQSGMDIDAQMPYGEAEPFGRENVAGDLTKSSKHESDAMVDQMERAESMEERRAVFRALTRLRGATITAYDGIAKSHLNNVVQYNKEHKWRDAHPMKHLAQEEDDVGKWAFPNNSEQVPPAAAGSGGPAPAPAPAAQAPGL